MPEIPELTLQAKSVGFSVRGQLRLYNKIFFQKEKKVEI
jgi:hypothetical protein